VEGATGLPQFGLPRFFFMEVMGVSKSSLAERLLTAEQGII
jgi:hypothetical protein